MWLTLYCTNNLNCYFLIFQFSGVNLSFLTYKAIKTHLEEAHRVMEESHLPSFILLPANLVHYSCKLCQDFRMKSKEELVVQHIREVHGEFFLTNLQDL